MGGNRQGRVPGAAEEGARLDTGVFPEALAPGAAAPTASGGSRGGLLLPGPASGQGALLCPRCCPGSV